MTSLDDKPESKGSKEGVARERTEAREGLQSRAKASVPTGEPLMGWDEKLEVQPAVTIFATLFLTFQW